MLKYDNNFILRLILGPELCFRVVLSIQRRIYANLNKEWVKFLLKNTLRHFIDMASKRGESFNINLN